MHGDPPVDGTGHDGAVAVQPDGRDGVAMPGEPRCRLPAVGRGEDADETVSTGGHGLAIRPQVRRERVDLAVHRRQVGQRAAGRRRRIDDRSGGDRVAVDVDGGQGHERGGVAPVAEQGAGVGGELERVAQALLAKRLLLLLRHEHDRDDGGSQANRKEHESEGAAAVTASPATAGSHKRPLLVVEAQQILAPSLLDGGQAAGWQEQLARPACFVPCFGRRRQLVEQALGRGVVGQPRRSSPHSRSSASWAMSTVASFVVGSISGVISLALVKGSSTPRLPRGRRRR